jgi:hypothetical protein
MLHAERQKSKNLKNAIEQAAEQLLDGMNGIEEDLPQAFVKLSKGHAAAMKTLLAVLAMVLVGCGGSAFSVGEGDDGGGDVVVRADGDDAGMHVAVPDAAMEAAPPEAAEADAGPACLSTLSNVGTNDFRIAFTLTTTAKMSTALVNQRSTCTASTEWDVFMSPGGGIEFETDDGVSADRVFVIGGGPVNDGQPHKIVAARTNGQIWVQTDDGIRSQLIPDPYAIDALPPLVEGSDPCTETVVLVGTIADLCVYIP